jgi:Flp pilus assembly protein TadG
MIGLHSLLRRLKRDARGVALLEFAFVAPILLVLFVGGYQLMDATSAYRKVTRTVRTLADLTTQSTSLTPDQATQILNASNKVMAPYPTANAVLRISQVQISATGVATISWSCAMNGSGYIQGSPVSLPAGMNQPSTYLIYSEINYNYVPNVASSMIGPIPLRDTILMSPRNSNSIPMTPNC